MAAQATDIVSAARLLRELRDRRTVETTEHATALVRSAVDWVSKHTYPLVDRTGWMYFRGPNVSFARDGSGWRFAPANSGNRVWTVRIPGIVSIEDAGWWGTDDADSMTPPNSMAAPDFRERDESGVVDLFPPSGGWPAGSRMTGLEVKRGWVATRGDAETIAQAVILMARELYDDSPEIAPDHPLWSLIAAVRPAYPVPEVLANA